MITFRKVGHSFLYGYKNLGTYSAEHCIMQKYLKTIRSAKYVEIKRPTRCNM
jgi:hypothetical protein